MVFGVFLRVRPFGLELRHGFSRETPKKSYLFPLPWVCFSDRCRGVPAADFLLVLTKTQPSSRPGVKTPYGLPAGVGACPRLEPQLPGVKSPYDSSAMGGRASASKIWAVGQISLRSFAGGGGVSMKKPRRSIPSGLLVFAGVWGVWSLS